MGRQRGLVQISGQFGDVRASISPDGKGIVSFSTPVSRNKVKKGSNYALTRENNDEFTGSAYSARTLRMCMGERIKQFADRYLSSRLMALTRSVLSKGPGNAGQRSFQVVPNLGMFKRIEAKKNESLTSRFMAPFTLTVNTDRNTATLDVPAFNVDTFLYRPQGATHFRLLLVAGVLSDFIFTGDNDVYAPVNPGINGSGAVAMSTTLPAVGVVNAALQLVAAVPSSPVLPATAGLVVSVGIEFLRVINNNEEVMAQGNALRVVEVF